MKTSKDSESQSSILLMQCQRNHRAGFLARTMTTESAESKERSGKYQLMSVHSSGAGEQELGLIMSSRILSGGAQRAGPRRL